MSQHPLAVFAELIWTPFQHLALVWGIVPLYFALLLSELTSAKKSFRTAIQTTSPEQILISQGISVIESDDFIPEEQQPTQLAQKLKSGKFVVAVEMDPPRGISTHKILAGASLLGEAGADVINVAPSFIRRLVPRLAREKILPGTANTSRPCSNARSAVMSAPLV